MDDPPADRVRAVAGAVAISLVGLVASAVVVVAAGQLLRAANVELGLTALVVLSLVLTQGVTFGGVALLYLRVRGLGLGFVGVAVPSLRDGIWTIAGYVLALGAAFVGAVIVTVTRAPTAQNRISEVATRDPEILLLLVPLSFLLIGPGEELLFRGIVQGTLRERFGPVGAVGIASAIFAAVHYLALSGGLGGRLVTIVVLFFPSLVFGAAYERTGNLVVPALIHGAYNATLFVLFYLALRFAEMPV